MDFVYAFDVNYNIQGFVAIKSLLDNVDEKININIIHNDLKSFENFKQELDSHKNCQKLNLYQFKSDNLNFPNIENKHVSEATYYRLYINQYLSGNPECVIYLDSDILCLNNPLPHLRNIKKQLLNEDLLLAARPEHIKNSNNNYIFKHLNLKSNSYFNGGVLVLNYRKWINEETFEKLQNTVANNKKDLLWWDQDILNQVVDGNFLELNNFYNFKLSLDWKINEDYINNEVVFLHYQGKLKPWNISGILHEHSNIYQNIFIESQYSSGRYHLVKENSIVDFMTLIRSIVNFRLFKLKNSLFIIYKVIFNIFNE